MQKSVTASFRQTGCWCRTLRRLKAAAEHGQRPAMAERFCGKDHAGVYSSGTARAAPITTDYAARRVPSDLNEPIDAPMSVNGSDDVLVFEFPGAREMFLWLGLLGADKTGKGHSR
jgi:hypothetical protein